MTDGTFYQIVGMVQIGFNIIADIRERIPTSYGTACSINLDWRFESSYGLLTE